MVYHIFLYTTRSQRVVIENSLAQREKSEQALNFTVTFYSYCKVLALPAHEFQVEVRVFN